jgi:LTXXQ motif family protein
MGGHLIRLSAILLGSTMVLATPAAAFAGGRGGGGGGHFGGGGGGHFSGGGGMHIGGGGGMHIGGGGMHIGGGGFHMGGAPFGGMHVGGPRIGGFSAPHIGGMHVGGMRGVPHVGGLGGARVGHVGGMGGRVGGLGGRIGGLHNPGLAGSHIGTRGPALAHGPNFNHQGPGFGHGLANEHRGPAFSHGPLTTGAAGAMAMAGHHRGQYEFGRHGEWHSANRHEWWRNRGAFGWAGPVFWPYAYNDFYDDVFWGSPGDGFWNYGYGDLYGGIFPGYDYDNLADYLPYAGTAAIVAPGGPVAQGPIAQGEPTGGGFAPLCTDTSSQGDNAQIAGLPIDRVQQAIEPDAQQQADLNALANASQQAAQIVSSACPSTVSFTPIGRLDAMQVRLEAMAKAIDVIRGPLDTFYGSLNEEQRARLNALGGSPEQQAAREQQVVRRCNAVTATTEWPTAQIERLVRPTSAQQGNLDALHQAMVDAAHRLDAACPTQLPVTPTARLAADAERVQTMLQVVDNVRGAAAAFYGSLSDEQRAQFDTVGRSGVAGR